MECGLPVIAGQCWLCCALLRILRPNQNYRHLDIYIMLSYYDWAALLEGELPEGYQIIYEDLSTHLRWSAVVDDVYNPKHYFLLFPGTDDADDVRADLSIWKRRYRFVVPYEEHPNSANWSDQHVHSGFYNAYLNICKGLGTLLAGIEKTDRTQLSLIGHSLGGAIAYFAALDVHYNQLWTREQIHVMTLGAPRIGNRPFVRSYRERLCKQTLRLVNSEDIVSRMPLTWLGYADIVPETLIGSPRGCLYLFPWRNDFKDHVIASYLRVLQDHKTAEA